MAVLAPSVPAAKCTLILNVAGSAGKFRFSPYWVILFSKNLCSLS